MFKVLTFCFLVCFTIALTLQTVKSQDSFYCTFDQSKQIAEDAAVSVHSISGKQVDRVMDVYPLNNLMDTFAVEIFSDLKSYRYIVGLRLRDCQILKVVLNQD